MRNSDLLAFLLFMLFVAAALAYLVFALHTGLDRQKAIGNRIARAFDRAPRFVLWPIFALAAAAAVYWLGMFGILFVLAFAACRAENWLHSRFDSKPLPITRRNLCRLSYGRGVRNLCVIMALSAVLVAILYAGGRIDGAAALPSLAVLWTIPLIDICILMRVQRTVLLSALQGVDVDAALRGRELLPASGSWQYHDSDWFICVGNRWCAVLSAGRIDFSTPVQVRRRSIGAGRDRLSTCEMLFAGRDGGRIRARLKPSPDIERWIQNHKGRLA